MLVSALALAMSGTVMLLPRQNEATVFAAVALAGLGCGPIFPLLAARLLGRAGTSRHLGWVFAMGGSGGAALPWLTGLISSQSGSLRAAFAVPLAALTAILVFTLHGNPPAAAKGNLTREGQ